MSSKSAPNMTVSERKKLVRDKFALLAKVGRQKKRASQFGDEAEFWATNVTELLAVLADALEHLEGLAPLDDLRTAQLRSEHIRLARRLLGFWPPNSESQNRVLNLLDCDGLAKVTELTREGFVILSSDLILENVERIIEATRAEDQSQSFDLTTKSTQLALVGIASNEKQTPSSS